jgi:hypothetical protein
VKTRAVNVVVAMIVASPRSPAVGQVAGSGTMTRAAALLATVVNVGTVHDATTVAPVIVQDGTTVLPVERVVVVFATTRRKSVGVAPRSSECPAPPMRDGSGRSVVNDCVIPAVAHAVETMHERVPVQRRLD